MNEVAEKVEEKEVDKVHEAFVQAQDKNVDEDGTKMAMIQAGASFKNVARLYNTYMIEAGLMLPKEDRDAIVKTACVNNDITIEEGMKGAIKHIVKAIPDRTERSAGALIRAYAKKNDIVAFVSEKEPTGPTGFTKRYQDWIVSTLKDTKQLPSMDDARKVIQGTDGNEETSANTKRNESHFLGYLSFAQRLLNK